MTLVLTSVRCILPPALLFCAGIAAAATFTVNRFADSVDATPGDGLCADAFGFCTLRAAIQEANALAGADTIVLPTINITLTIAGAGEDAAATGDLDITSDIVINGAGAQSSIINGGGLDRVFDVLPGASLTLRDLQVTGGGGGANGAGIQTRGPLILERVAVVGNNGAFGGGLVAFGIPLTISQSEFSGNTGTGQGGAMNLQAGTTAALTNVTISGNSAAGAVGGVVNIGTLTVTNVTFANNAEGVAFAANLATAGPTTLANSLLVTGGATNCGGGAFTDAGGNYASGAPCGAIVVTPAVGANLGPLALNAPGATRTHALLAGNPAINTAVAGLCPANDQRGVVRDLLCDSGAFEFAAAAVLAPIGVPTIGSGPMAILALLLGLVGLGFAPTTSRNDKAA